VNIGKDAVWAWKVLSAAAKVPLGATITLFEKLKAIIGIVFGFARLQIVSLIEKIGLWITAFGGLGKIYFDTINKIALAIWGFIKTVGAAFASLWPAIVSLATAIGGVFVSLFEVVGTAITGVWGVIRAVFGGIPGFFSKLWGAIKIGFGSAVSGIKATWSGLLPFLVKTFAQIGTIFAGTGTIIYSVMGDIGTAFVNMGGRMMDTWGGVIDAIGAGDFQLAFQIITAGAKLVWFGFVDEMRGAWIQFNIDVVNWAQKATTSMIKIWRNASQSIASWMADLGYDMANFWTGQQDLLTPEERRGARDSSLNTSYDNMTGGMTDVTDPFFAEIQKILEERKKDPAAQANIQLLQDQLDALRAAAKTAKEEADKAAEDRKTNEWKPDLGLSEAKAQAATMPGTFVGGTKEAADQALKHQNEYQSEAREALRKQDVLIYLTRKLVDKPGVGVAGA
jgi:hypothetical protein